MTSAWFTLLAVAWGQDAPIPQMLDVVTIEDTTPCPDIGDGIVPGVIRTNVGVLAPDEPGSYTYVCASRWGGAQADEVIASADGQTLHVRADGGLYRATDGGCVFNQVAFDPVYEVVDILSWRQALWVLLAAEPVSAVGGLLLRGEDDGTFTEVWRWDDTVDRRFEPTAMADGGTEAVWVTGLEPAPQVRRLSVGGGLREAVPDMPPELPPALTGMIPRAADDDEAWLVLERGNTRWTWHVQVIEGDAGVLLAVTEPELRTTLPILGPVRREGSFVSVIDNRIHVAAPLSGSWVDSGQVVPWTCLQRVGDRIYACQVRELLHVTGLGSTAAPTTQPVASFLQVSGPVPTCSDSDCATAWGDVVTRAGIDPNSEVAVCPDGRTASDLDPAACACRTGSPGPVWAWGLGVLGWMRRRRR